jgi:hypothetical protein
MFDLFDRYFLDPSREIFSRDLDRKDWAIVVEDGDRNVCGFTTIRLHETELAGRPLSVVYSGDTIVDGVARCSRQLAATWLSIVDQLRTEGQGRDFYWLLLSSGFRTYRFMPVFWRTFYPRHDTETPPEVAGLMEALATEMFGECWAPESGIVRLPDPQVLRASSRGVPAHRLRDPDVAFFVERNPGHESGDELVCITELSRDNQTAAGRRTYQFR